MSRSIRKKEKTLISQMTPAESHRYMLSKYSHIKLQIDTANGEKFSNGMVKAADTYRSPYDLRKKRGRTADGQQK
ncbi:hypothetical protein [Pantoea sp. CCBC3-3-1]|uniref:hypothetical protein n=1 Tax=Pantoea sp. CCBC3-3-1 TaxID=2490851 RepID=UPI0011BF72C3|nr:hypothetical protein [Pantoea sp. CCBC3-3-1]